MERRTAPVELRAWNLHVIQGLGEEDVESTASVDQHPVEFDCPDDGIQNQGLTTWMRDVIWVVRSVESDWHLRPLKILEGDRCDRIDLPSSKLLLSLGLICCRSPIYHV